MLEIAKIPQDRPVLIAGPTASGKSALALKIAATGGGVIVNADALQVFNGWRILTARPDEADLQAAPHFLYGHVGFDQPYSVGHWLREISDLLEKPPARMIIVGGTGLYFKALTEGLADIPQTPPDIRACAAKKSAAQGLQSLLDDLDSETLSRIDTQNPVRVQRAWEVQRNTGRTIAQWQDNTPAPLLPLNKCYPIVFQSEKGWLNERIERRFDIMLENGALNEAAKMLPHWNPAHLSSKAIGARDLIAHLKGEMPLDHARAAAITASRQYAKRQRTWFRARMRNWNIFSPEQGNF